MCSILCYAGKDVTKETMEGYLLKTKMRGPDAQQVVETEFGYLGFARLAIMGLTPDGMQPFQRDGSWVICRFSGTEPLLRMAAEADDQSRAEGYIAAWRAFLGL